MISYANLLLAVALNMTGIIAIIKKAKQKCQCISENIF